MKAIIVASCLALGLAVSASAQTDKVIVNVTGNTGSDLCNSTLIGATAGFAISSYSLGGSIPVSAGTGAGKVTLSDLVISKPFSGCSGELLKDFLTSKLLPTVTLYDYKQSGGTGSPSFDFLKITLTNVLISSYQLSDSAATVPQEALSLTYTKVCISDTPQNANGSAGTTTTVCYDKAVNVID